MEVNFREFFRVKNSYIMKFLFLLFLCVFTFPLNPLSSAQAAILYVDKDATGANDGSSWSDAYTDLQGALAAAGSGDDIWVAEERYKPTSGTARTATFQLKSGVALYGGFNGTEESREERDWTVNVTVLSGDINDNDNGFDNNDENVYHVVTGANNAVIDGFTITGGNANGSYPNDCGGGIENDGSSPTITNCTISVPTIPPPPQPSPTLPSGEILLAPGAAGFTTIMTPPQPSPTLPSGEMTQTTAAGCTTSTLLQRSPTVPSRGITQLQTVAGCIILTPPIRPLPTAFSGTIQHLVGPRFIRT